MYCTTIIKFLKNRPHTVLLLNDIKNFHFHSFPKSANLHKTRVNLAVNENVHRVCKTIKRQKVKVHQFQSCHDTYVVQ